MKNASEYDSCVQEYGRCILECHIRIHEYGRCILERDICIQECDRSVHECDRLIQDCASSWRTRGGFAQNKRDYADRMQWDPLGMGAPGVIKVVEGSLPASWFALSCLLNRAFPQSLQPNQTIYTSQFTLRLFLPTCVQFYNLLINIQSNVFVCSFCFCHLHKINNKSTSNSGFLL